MHAEPDRPYCTLEDVQGVSGANDPDLDGKFVLAINEASRMVDSMTGRDFWFHEYIADGFPVQRRSVIGTIVYLPFEIIDLTSVEIDGVEVDVDGGLLEIGSTVIESSGPWGTYPFSSAMKVFGKFGFALQLDENDEPITNVPPLTIPAPVRRATALIAASFSNEWRKERVAPDGSRESLLEVRIPAEAVSLLRQWDIRKRFATF